MSAPSIDLDTLLERYDGLLLDAYGVLVNLDGALPGAAALIDRLNRTGKPYWLLSNTAARLPENAAARYRGYGLDIPADRILTSGMLLAPYFARHALAGRATLVMGTEDSRRYVESAGGAPVPPGTDFEILVLADQAGYPLLETVDQVLSTLFARLDGGRVPRLLLPNPDLIYPTSHGYGITAGSVALMLQAALAQRYPDRDDLRFVALGKPHPALFEVARARAGEARLVMLGDQLETDILGAKRCGIDAVLVTGGVAGSAWAHALPNMAPTYVLDGLAVPPARS